MRSLLALLLLLFPLGLTAEAQIIAVHFKDAKSAKKYQKHLVEFRGEKVVIGEPKSGFVYQPERNNLSYVPNSSNELFVVNPDKPGDYAYFVVKGKKEASSKKNRLVIQGGHIERLSIAMRDQTLTGLTQEYNIRTEQIDDFRADRDSYEQSSKEWQSRHVRLVTAMERLGGWLESTGFPGAIKKLNKEIERENKVVRGEAVRARGEKAVASVKKIEIPETLTRLSKEISGGRDKFYGYESQHLRIYYIDKIGAEQAKGALELGEEVIEGFRTEFVDPYLSDDYVDHIPDGHFHEFFFVPEDLPSYEKYTNGFYGISWRENREARLAMTGGNTTGGFPRGLKHYWKTTDNTDLPGIFCHCLGHSLASLHYGKGGFNMNQDWLSEAVGYQLSFEFLGRNNVTCKAFNKDKAGYAKRKVEKKEGEKTVGIGRRDIYNEVALEKGRPIDQIALKNLFEIDDPDLAKSWSFYDYVSRKEGKAGQEWLRAAGEFSSNRSTFMAKWREAAASALGVPPARAFKALEERWRAYAEGGQKKDDKPGRGRR